MVGGWQAGGAKRAVDGAVGQQSGWICMKEGLESGAGGLVGGGVPQSGQASAMRLPWDTWSLVLTRLRPDSHSVTVQSVAFEGHLLAETEVGVPLPGSTRGCSR